MVLVFFNVLKFVSIVVPLLISVAYFTIAERKIMGAIQRRQGPNIVGFLGLLQPFSDGLKLFTKELIFPVNANTSLFILAPIKLKIKATIGANTNKLVFALTGKISSFVNNFKPSAKGCNNPKNPILFGPLRRCIAPMIFRSAIVK